MRKGDDDGRMNSGQRSGRGNRAILGLVIVLGVATLSAYYISGKDRPVQPASGAANAMALASSKPSAR
ncbi:hypothetical protein OSJ57_20350 [Sphingomonas sp. HH69]